MGKMWRGLRDIIVYRILHVDDSPHRIALGVAIAFFVAWTPTIGMQMILAVSLASLLGGNKAVTIPIVWITNPFTAVPLYYANWRFGRMIRHGTLEHDPTVRQTLAKLMVQKGSLLSYVYNLVDPEWWRDLLRLIAECGIDLWIGSVIVGLALALVSYPAFRWAVVAYRRVRHRDGADVLARAADTAAEDVVSDEPTAPAKSNAQP